jgi:hypothetical protein
MCGYVTCLLDCRGSVRCVSHLSQLGDTTDGTTTIRHTDYVTTLYDIPPILFVHKVTQKDLRGSLIMAGYCRNM